MDYRSFLLAIVVSGCCTKKYCPCEEPEILLELKTDQTSASFSDAEIDAFELILTDEQFSRVDSAKAWFNLQNEDRVLRLTEEYFGAHRALLRSAFILKNNLLGSSDTISSVHYDSLAFSMECNECMFKQDEYTCYQFTNKSVIHNNKLLSDFKILIEKKL